MERKLDEMIERIVRLETASEFRHHYIVERFGRLEMLLHSPQPHGNGGWFKVPLALCLPILVFLLMLAITGDLRTALNAARLAG